MVRWDDDAEIAEAALGGGIGVEFVEAGPGEAVGGIAKEKLFGGFGVVDDEAGGGDVVCFAQEDMPGLLEVITRVEMALAGRGGLQPGMREQTAKGAEIGVNFGEDVMGYSRRRCWRAWAMIVAGGGA